MYHSKARFQTYHSKYKSMLESNMPVILFETCCIAVSVAVSWNISLFYFSQVTDTVYFVRPSSVFLLIVKYAWYLFCLTFEILMPPTVLFQYFCSVKCVFSVLIVLNIVGRYQNQTNKNLWHNIQTTRYRHNTFCTKQKYLNNTVCIIKISKTTTN